MGSTPIQHSVLNVKALVGTFNQEKALLGAFSMITNLRMDFRFKFYPEQTVAKLFRDVGEVPGLRAHDHSVIHQPEMEMV